MNNLYRLRPLWQLLIFVLLDTLLVGMGMGLPIFCILFGFVLGWFLVKCTTFTFEDAPQVLRKVLQDALVTSGVTLVGMLILWGSFARYLFNPGMDLVKTGIPMILYEPRASLIGWIVLMILISPFLQLLTTLSAAYLTILGWMRTKLHDQKAV
jgi:hypothetical protein